MKPDVPVVLSKLSQTLLAQLLPELGPGYAQGSTVVSSLVLQAAAEEWDRSAARRVEENGAIRALFREALPAVEDETLREHLADAAAEGDGDLHLSALDRTNDHLRALLISLHAHVEELAAPEARDLEAAIWRELRRSTERRAISIAPF
ncbi:MAG: hypothetical protein QNK04_00320 [Myxococcota bacterium]|nr:hypothetical protein [Myxococcota bacterium]